MCNNSCMNLPKRKTSNWNRVAKEYDTLVEDSGDFNHKIYINPVSCESSGCDYSDRRI